MSKNKIMIIAASAMVVIAIVLVVVIAKVSSVGSSEDELTIENSVSGELTGDLEQLTTPDPTTTPEPTALPTEQKDDSLDPETPTPAQEAVTEVKLGNYKGLEASYSPVTITDEDIENALKKLQEENIEIVDMPERGFEEGDLAIVTYEGKIDGETIDELYEVCFQVVLGKGTLPTAFENNIIGRSKGESFIFDMEYPADYKGIEGVAGKKVTFEVELENGFIFQEPEINDEFIKTVTEYESVEEYKTKEKERLQSEENDKADKSVRDSLKKQVVDNSTFPESIDNEIKKSYVLKLEEENNKWYEEYLMDADTFYQMAYGYEPGQFAKELMESTTYDVKYDYVLKEIAKRENITTEEADKLIYDSAVIKK